MADYVYLDGIPLALTRKQGNNEETFFYHNDHLGTPKVMTDKLGKVVWNVEFDPFGNDISAKARQGVYIRNVENNLRFPGQFYDAETGLHYNYFRDYNPKTGRYVESDPIGLRGGLDIYNYVHNNTINRLDPSGLFDAIVYETGSKNGIIYGASITVIGDNGQVVTVPGSSWPNPNNANPGIVEGQYSGIYSQTAHKMGTKDGIIINNNDFIPTVGPNGNQNKEALANYIHLHCGYSKTNRGSAGCITVEPDYCQKLWDILEEGETGYVTVIRR